VKFTKFLVGRILVLIPVLLGITLATFVLTRMVPGDPARAIIGEGASAEALAALRTELGLDLPLPQQYLHYLGDLLQGDLGNSIRTGRPIASELAGRFGATAELALAALVLTIVVGVSLGLIAALNRGKLIDELCRMIALIGVSVPIFWFGILLILLFYLQLGWAPAPLGRFGASVSFTPDITGLYVVDALLRGNLPALGDALRHLALPAITLAAWSTAIVMRITRASVLEVMGQDYIRTARAKGLSARLVIGKHMLRNALLPMITIIGLEFGNMLGGAVLTETVYNWPGMGQYAVSGINSLDFAAIQGFTLLTAFIYVLINLVVDALYVAVDPRVEYS